MGKRIIIAGGGTGGHIFPAIAIANALKKEDKSTEILFVGAKGRMEMEKIPQAGYEIRGLDIVGFNRSSLIKNIGLPFKLFKSFSQVRSIFREFRPDAVIGVGGYSSFPVLRHAQAVDIPSFIHESNSFAGKANKMLGKKADRIFTGSEGMEKFFPAKKIMITGNPVRSAISGSTVTRSEGLHHFILGEGKKTLLVFGGSLGARSINEAILNGIARIIDAGLQVIWQTGKEGLAKVKEQTSNIPGLRVSDFIPKMEYAYAAADIVVSRAGAMTVAELCVAKKPVVFVPYPHAAEDHQTKNALQLVNKNAAMMVKDSDVSEKLIDEILGLAKDEAKQNQLSNNIALLAIMDADKKIAHEILQTINSGVRP